ncbi:amidohydrolase [Bacillus benzoevorans]|uniref:Imidazolonepropionase-like amidohydrolase n=1 Tax=Bacillus benzoevorans TaxID=1456 RepID=A0A7X0HV67_9BACI|nr:amidohydrolase [Bacillus benzoevorans]MBB6446522.1 imidazolonepropionase-like amidohydrolase [Bacillus benzoevorans]
MNKVLLKNAFIHPITQSPFFGDLLVGNGIILDIGLNLAAMSDTRVYDCAGLYLFPGFIDVHTHLGLYDEGIGEVGNDANDSIEPLNPHIRALDGVYPQDPAFAEAVRAGITTVHVMPGSANIIGGTTSVIKTSGSNIQTMLVKETAGLKIALGENPKRVHSYGKKNSLTRMGIMGRLREIFYEAKYCEEPEKFRLAPIIKALEKEIPVRIHAHRADDILSAIRFAEEFALDLRIEHCTEGHLIANELADRGLKVSVGPTLTRRSKDELKHKSWQTYQVLSGKGIEVSITTDHPYIPIQYLNICAAIAVREGLSEQLALEGMTILPARNLGLEHRIGSVAKGKDADLVLWSHHPFYFMAKPKWTMINGIFIE